MGFLNNESTAPEITVTLTDAGRALLANGFKLDNIFDIVKFSFGDSDVDYFYDNGDPDNGDPDTVISDQLLSIPTSGLVDLSSKLYYSGIEPEGDAMLSLTQSTLNLTVGQTSESIGVSTSWPPVEGLYIEQYSWVNLGPMLDYEVQIIKSTNTTSATVRSLGVTGTTNIRVKGLTSGVYTILSVTIA